MGFPGAKTRGNFFNFRKTDHYKKVLFAQGLFFRSSEHNHRKRREFFSMQVPYLTGVTNDDDDEDRRCY